MSIVIVVSHDNMENWGAVYHDGTLINEGPNVGQQAIDTRDTLQLMGGPITIVDITGPGPNDMDMMDCLSEAFPHNIPNHLRTANEIRGYLIDAIIERA